MPITPGKDQEIPITYVPARNTILLSLALGWAEALGGLDIFYGANSVDYSGYPDCRPEYVASFETLANLATKAGVEAINNDNRSESMPRLLTSLRPKLFCWAAI